MKSNPLASFALALGGVALLATACSMVGKPSAPITNFLSGGDETLANAVRWAAAEWARHGLEIANYVTVDDGRAGLPVRRAKQATIQKSCESKKPLAGCVYWYGGDWLEMLIRDDVADEFVPLVVLHEIIHALVPDAPHTPDTGVFNADINSNVITTADMDNLARFTEVTPV